jgi:hypothetical protein
LVWNIPGEPLVGFIFLLDSFSRHRPYRRLKLGATKKTRRKSIVGGWRR